MALNARIGAAKFVIIPEPLATRILASDQPKLLSRAVKSRLFQTLIPFSDEHKSNAADLFKRVNILSGGTVEQTFELKSDDIDGVPFRVLNPRGLQTDNCDRPKQEDGFIESYVAASYCWQWPQDDLEDATDALSFPLPMSPLLYNALLNERQSPSEGVWIDQICINQDEESEKQAAVNSMDIIYKGARAVVIILDDIEITKTEQDALRFYVLEFEKITREGPLYPFYDDDPPYLTTNVLMRNIYLKIVRARWFSRAWCMHETRLGKQHIFLIRCEHQPHSPPLVFRFTNLFMLHLISLAIKAKLARTQVWLIPVLTRAIDDNMGVELRIASFMQVSAEIFSQDAGGNPRIASLAARKYDANLDKLSIAMNTIGIGLAVSRRARDLEHNYPPPTEDECCRRFTIVALAAGDPTALCTSGNELQTNSVQRTSMRKPLLTEFTFYKLHWIGNWTMSFDPSPAARWIGLNIGVFNRAGGLRWATQARIKICGEFLRRCGSMGITMGGYGGKKLELSNEVWKKLIIETLACAMDCVLGLVDSIRNEELGMDGTQLVMDGLQKLLDSEAEITPDDPAESVPLWTIQEFPKAQSLIDMAMYLIHKGPAVETELGQSMDFWHPACMGNETGSKVLTFVDGFRGKKSFVLRRLSSFLTYRISTRRYSVRGHLLRGSQSGGNEVGSGSGNTT